MQDQSDNFHTYDGVKIEAGLRVWSPYPYQWGNIEAGQFVDPSPLTGVGGQYFDGWYYVDLDDGTRETLNGTRMATKQLDPNSPADPKA
jgi:hypothetical protein